MYYKGRGVLQDLDKALKWIKKAASQGYPDAQSTLGSMYYRGKGVPQDDINAYKWLNLAAAQGHKKAAKARDAISKTMTPVQLSKAQELAREWKPVE